MSHIWTWMPNCVCSVRPLTPVPHPYNPLLILPCSVGLRPAHSVEQNAGLLISSFRADQWHWWQEPKRRLCTKWGLNKTAFLNDCLGANNPLAEWGHEVGDLGGCSSGGVRLRLRRGGGSWVPGVPAGGPAEQTAGNKARLQCAETQSSSHGSPVSGQTRQDFRPTTAWRQRAAFFSGEKATSDQGT